MTGMRSWTAEVTEIGVVVRIEQDSIVLPLASRQDPIFQPTRTICPSLTSKQYGAFCSLLTINLFWISFRLARDTGRNAPSHRSANAYFEFREHTIEEQTNRIHNLHLPVPCTLTLWIHKVCRLVEKFLDLRLGHPYLLALVRAFDGLNQELPSKLVVGFKEVWRIKGWRS